jgi:hypothetical protein
VTLGSIDKIARPTESLTNGDVWHAIVKATAGTLPVVGPVVSELFQLAITTPSQLRQSQWHAAVSEVLNNLIAKVEGISPESLSKNEEFLTAIMATSSIAMKTAQKEKIKMLQAILYHSGSGTTLEIFVRNTFMQIVDRYVPEHLDLLKLLTEKSSLESAFNKFKAEFPEQVGKNDSGISGEHCTVERLPKYLVPETIQGWAHELFDDLHRDGLVQGSEGFAFTYSPATELNIVTARGRAFIEFVSIDGVEPDS